MESINMENDIHIDAFVPQRLSNASLAALSDGPQKTMERIAELEKQLAEQDVSKLAGFMRHKPTSLDLWESEWRRLGIIFKDALDEATADLRTQLAERDAQLAAERAIADSLAAMVRQLCFYKNDIEGLKLKAINLICRLGRGQGFARSELDSWQDMKQQAKARVEYKSNKKARKYDY